MCATAFSPGQTSLALIGLTSSKWMTLQCFCRPSFHYPQLQKRKKIDAVITVITAFGQNLGQHWR
jgi:hypothetical protein